MLKRTAFILLIFTFFLEAAGCQPTPETETVTSKNDGTFEAALQSTAEPAAEDTVDSMAETADTETYTASFASADGTVSCEILLEDVGLPSTAMPVIQVTPHEITSEEAERVAKVLFGDAAIYEYSEEMTKTQIEETILSLKQKISDRDGLLEYYDGDETLTDQIISQYETMIERYEQLYQIAPEALDAILCDFVFRPMSYYEDTTALESVSTDWESYNKSLYVEAMGQVNGQMYTYKACNRSESDYRIHNIWFYQETDEATADSYSTLKQDEDAILENARNILEQMDMGEWEIDSCETNDFTTSDGEQGSYTEIIACPVYNGVKVTHQSQLVNLKSDDAYASNYYYEQITMEYSGGVLSTFEFESPMEVVTVINDNVELLSFEEIMERLETQMKIGVSSSEEGDIISEASTMSLLVNEMEVGLVRTRIKNNETDFYLVPAYTFRGEYTLYDESGDIIFSSTELDEGRPLAVINAVDGSIIDVSKGY